MTEQKTRREEASGTPGTQGRYVKHWAVLAVIFLILSADEAAAIHGLTIHPILTALRHLGWRKRWNGRPDRFHNGLS